MLVGSIRMVEFRRAATARIAFKRGYLYLAVSENKRKCRIADDFPLYCQKDAYMRDLEYKYNLRRKLEWVVRHRGEIWFL